MRLKNEFITTCDEDNAGLAFIPTRRYGCIRWMDQFNTKRIKWGMSKDDPKVFKNEKAGIEATLTPRHKAKKILLIHYT
jgi:hypothetical protein